jgi:hypothetical protein
MNRPGDGTKLDRRSGGTPLTQIQRIEDPYGSRRRRRHRQRRVVSKLHDRAGRRFARFVGARPILMAVILGALHLILSLLTFQPQPHTGGDNAAYLSLGQSLLEHGALLTLYDPVMPPHTQYPPVFPGILAVSMAAGLEPWAQLKIVLSIFSAVAVAFTWLWIDRRRRPALAIGVAGIVAFSPGVLEQGHWILSDVPFWTFTMIALWGFERIGPALRARYAVGVIAAVLAYFTRSAGLPLALAIAAWLGLRRRWLHLAVFAGVLGPLALLWWLRARQYGGIDYVSQFWFVNPYAPDLGRIGVADLIDRIIENASKYTRIHLPILLTGTAGALPLVLSLGTIAAGIYGWAMRLRRPGIAELFLPLYIGLLLIWPAVWSGERFLLPALPVILYFAGDGLVRMARRISKPSGFLVGATATALALVLAMPVLAVGVAQSGRCMIEYRSGNRYACHSPAWRDFFLLAEWAQAELPVGSAALTRKPSLFWAISGHHSRNYPMSPEPDSLIAAARDANARYIVVDHLDGLSQLYLTPAILARPGAFCLVYQSSLDGTAVLGVRDDAEAVPDAADPSAPASIPQCARGWLTSDRIESRQPAPDSAAIGADSGAAVMDSGAARVRRRP